MIVENVGNFPAACQRYNDMIRSNRSMDRIVNSLNAEFHMSFYISNGKLWTSYIDDRAVPQKRTIAIV